MPFYTWSFVHLELVGIVVCGLLRLLRLPFTVSTLLAKHNFGVFRNADLPGGTSPQFMQRIVCNRQDKLRIINTKVLPFCG